MKVVGKHVWSFGVILYVWFVLIRDSWSLPFSLIDDTQFADKFFQIKNLVENGRIVDGFRSFFVIFPGIKEGRFAPVFWLSYLSRFTLAGTNPFWHHFLHSLLILSVLVLLYFVVWEFTKRRWLSLLSVIFFCLLSPGFENWYRISTQEPIQAFSLLLLIWILKRSLRVNWPVVVASVVFLLSKEISILFFPSFIVWNLVTSANEKKKMNGFLRVFLVLSMIFGVLLLLVIRNATWSASNASLSFIWPSLAVYLVFWKQYQFIPLVLAGLAIVVLFWQSKVKNELKTALVFLVFSVNGYLALLPWKYPLVRFMFTQKIGLAVFLGITFGIFISWCFRQIRYRSVVASVCLVFLALLLTKVAFINFQSTDMFRSNYVGWEVSNGQLMQKFASLPLGSNVCVNVSKQNPDAHEWVERMPLYLNVFYTRPDVNVGFVDDQSEIFDYIADWNIYRNDLTQLGAPIWSTSIKTSFISPSLKSLIISSFKKQPASFAKEYKWDLYSI